jgi:hypothetical protein
MVKTSILRLLVFTMGMAICCSLFLHRSYFFGVNAPQVTFLVFLGCCFFVTLVSIIASKVPVYFRIPGVSIVGGMSINSLLHGSRFPQFWIVVCLVVGVFASVLLTGQQEKEQKVRR